MTTMVCFRAAGVRYAIPVESARSVCTANGLIALPGQRGDVLGVLPGDPVLSVISPLDADPAKGAGHILVVTTPYHDFGLLVDAVTEVCAFDESGIRPAPAGQATGLIVGVAERAGGLVLIADPVALGARL